MKTLYLHIGTPKTGTTAIQNFCNDNQDILNQYGYYYPIYPYRYLSASKLRNAHFIFGCLNRADGSRDFEGEKKALSEGFQHIYEAFEKFDNIILSDEGLWTCGFRDEVSAWSKVKKELDKGKFAIKVIVYLRPQDEFLCSWWSQRIKEGNREQSKLTWEEMSSSLPTIKLDYYKMLERIAEYVGKDNIIVRRFDRSQFSGGTIYEDFLGTIGLAFSEEYQIKNELKNISLTKNSNEIKRILNQLPGLDSERNVMFRKVLLQQSQYHKEENFSMFSEEERNQFMEKYDEGNARIAKEYLGTEDPLFYDKKKEIRKWNPEDGYMLEDVILFTGSMMMQMDKRLREQERQLAVIQKTIKHPVRMFGKKIKRKVIEE
ncbi:MAG: hypothetical protein ACI4A3_08235 [Lachnospiraceae bacterium]